MKPRRVLVVGCVVSQQRIAHILPECQVIRYEDGMMLEPDAIVICCDDRLFGDQWTIAWQNRFGMTPIYLLRDRSSRTARRIGDILKWPIILRHVQVSNLRNELLLEQEQADHPVLF